MKITPALYILLALGLLASPRFVAATPLHEDSIPQSIDWFVHLDADQLRSSTAGAMLLDGLMDLDPLKENGQLPINPIQVIDGLRGITAFGTIPDLEKGGNKVDVVTVLSGTPELVQIFRGLVSGFQLEKPDAIEQTVHGTNMVLSMKQAGIHGVFMDDEQIALSKSMDSMNNFLSVRDGTQPHLNFADRFPIPLSGPNMGIYLGVYVEGLSGFENMPAQARILQLTQAVAVQLGESNESLHLLASLVTDQDQTAQQVNEVLRGIIAMLVLTQNGQSDLAALIQSARVEQQGNAVTLKVDYPAASTQKWIGLLLEKIQEQMTEDEVGPEAGPEADTEPQADTAVGSTESVPVD